MFVTSNHCYSPFRSLELKSAQRDVVIAGLLCLVMLNLNLVVSITPIIYLEVYGYICTHVCVAVCFPLVAELYSQLPSVSEEVLQVCVCVCTHVQSILHVLQL